MESAPVDKNGVLYWDGSPNPPRFSPDKPEETNKKIERENTSIESNILQCVYCGFINSPRTTDPVRCPRCGNPYGRTPERKLYGYMTTKSKNGQKPVKLKIKDIPLTPVMIKRIIEISKSNSTSFEKAKTFTKEFNYYVTAEKFYQLSLKAKSKDNGEVLTEKSKLHKASGWDFNKERYPSEKSNILHLRECILSLNLNDGDEINTHQLWEEIRIHRSETWVKTMLRKEKSLPSYKKELLDQYIFDIVKAYHIHITSKISRWKFYFKSPNEENQPQPAIVFPIEEEDIRKITLYSPSYEE